MQKLRKILRASEKTALPIKQLLPTTWILCMDLPDPSLTNTSQIENFISIAAYQVNKAE